MSDIEDGPEVLLVRLTTGILSPEKSLSIFLEVRI